MDTLDYFNGTILSVSQLNRHVKILLEQHFFSTRIVGEISSLSQPASGHFYFSLKDQHAQIHCALFKRQAQRLKYPLKNGLQVQVTADVSLYEARGDYQLIINDIQETGNGHLHQAFEALKIKLEHKGWFATKHKKTLPLIPQCIGIITSSTGAAVHDIQSTLSRRFPSTALIIYPIQVQGVQAKHHISHAIKKANHRQECELLILARGGGSLEDLWPFNEECVAEAIYHSHLPIITGIGHETDTTIADYVSDLRAATPTAAAEHSTPDSHQWQHKFQQHEQQLHRLLINTINQHHQHLHWLCKTLNQYPPNKQRKVKSQSLERLYLRLQQAIRNILKQKTIQVQQQSTKLLSCTPKYSIQILKQKQQQLHERLLTKIQFNIQKKQQQLSYSSQMLNLISPLTVLQRGYSISKTTINQALLSSQQINLGDTIKTILNSGSCMSTITHITHE